MAALVAATPPLVQEAIAGAAASCIVDGTCSAPSSPQGVGNALIQKGAMAGRLVAEEEHDGGADAEDSPGKERQNFHSLGRSKAARRPIEVLLQTHLDMEASQEQTLAVGEQCAAWCGETDEWCGYDECKKCDPCIGWKPPTPAPTTPAPTQEGCALGCILDWCSVAACSKCSNCPTPEPTPPPTLRLPELFGTSCDARYLRLENQLHIQPVWQVPTPDPQFPNDMRSIAGPNEKCGDTAQGISNGCDKYDHWKTFQEVTDEEVKVIGPSGVQYTDVGQGDLGTCYFLATIASIAYQQPKMIEDMFPTEFQDLYKQNIYTTKWWLNGKEHLLRVDNQIPADAGGPVFAGMSPTKEFWPLILEKTWAKIVGNYKAQEGGRFDEVMLAITRAPTRTIKDLKSDPEGLWAAMLAAAAAKAPQTAWCKTGKYGLSGSHVYAVMNVEVNTAGKKVKVYNPWRSDNYKGSLDDQDVSQGDGTFWMTFEEFQQAFEWYWISEAVPNYRTMGYQAVPGNKAMKVSMTVASEDKFIVCLNWPKARILTGATCSNYLFVQSSMTVCKDDGAGSCANGSTVTGQEMVGGGGGLLFATMGSGAGKYIATIASKYDKNFAFIEKLSVTVYSDGADGAVEMTATEDDGAKAADPVIGANTVKEEVEGCEGWCGEDWCLWENGATCGKCDFCTS